MGLSSKERGQSNLLVRPPGSPDGSRSRSYNYGSGHSDDKSVLFVLFYGRAPTPARTNRTRETDKMYDDPSMPGYGATVNTHTF